MSQKTYRAVSAFAQGATRYDKGVILTLTDKQATFLVAGGFIELVPVEAGAEPATDDGGFETMNPPKKGADKAGGKA